MKSIQLKTFLWLIATLIVIGLMYVLFCYIEREQETILSYQDCKVSFKYSGTLDTLDLEYQSAKKELAGCLCESYIKTGDTRTSKRIMELYNRYGNPIKPDSSKYDAYKNLDSIIKYQKSVFDTMILLD